MSAQEIFYSLLDITVDCENFRVHKDGQIITLTPRAFDVLLCLVKNGGRVVEKQEIFDCVWKDTFVGDNALTKIIKEIRHALGDDANNPHYIETVPKRGYRIIADLSDVLPRAADVKVAESQTSNDKFQNKKQRPKNAKQNYKYGWALFIGIIVVCLGVAALYYFTRGDRSNNQIKSEAIDSIAVLPFENATQDPNVEYLSDGITESLINRLSLLSNLRVMSRGSVFHYKGKEQDAQKVGGELNVRAVLTGSVKQIGEQIEITVRLDDAQNNQHIWGEQYVRKFADILVVQSEIARDISSKLKTKLAGTDEQKLAKKYTENTEAFQLYLKGRFYWNKRTGESIKKAIEYFNQAIEKDPGYALAYVGLADCYVVPANPQPPREKMPKSRAAAMRALELDETLAEAHTALARVLAVYDWDWEGAEKEFKRAIEPDPRYAIAHQWYGDYLGAIGRHNEAIVEEKRALELDPLSLTINFELGLAFYYARDYDQAIRQFQKTLEMDPNFPPVYAPLPAAYGQKGMYDKAIAGFQKGITMRGGTEWSFSMSGLGYLYAVSGKKAEARAVLDELKRMGRQEYVPADSIAHIYAGLGEKDQAFTWLEKAYEEHSFQIFWLKAEPQWDSLRSDPRFTDLLRRIGLQP